MNELMLEVTEESVGARIDKWLSEQDTGITRSAAAGLIESGNVRVNGKNVAKNYKLRCGDSVKISIPEIGRASCRERV